MSLSRTLRFAPLFALMLLLHGGCTKESAAGADGGGTGRGGSLARFTIAKGHLYVVDAALLSTYSLQDGSKPVLVSTLPLQWDVETIYPYGDQLFIGAATGMYIYSITDPAKPVKQGEARHLRACDPVVSDGATAYVTLKGNSPCGPATSGLYVYDIRNAAKPGLLKIIELNEPAGLGLEGGALYVACGSNGLKVFSLTNPHAPVLKGTVTGAHFVDVIPYNGLLIAFVQNGIRLYDIADSLNPVLLQEITQ